MYLRCTLVSTLTNTVQTSVYTYTTVAVFKVYCILFTRTRYKPLNAEHTRTHTCLHGTAFSFLDPCLPVFRHATEHSRPG